MKKNSVVDAVMLMLASLASGSGARAAPPAPADVLAAENKIVDIARIPGGSYTIVKDHSVLQFEAGHFGLSAFLGRFDDVDGTLNFAPGNMQATRFELKFATGSVDTRLPKLDEHLKAADFLNVASFPEATFTSTHVAAGRDRSYVVTGTLTLHGVTRPMTVHATFNGGSINPFTKLFTVGFSGVAIVKRSEFGITTFLPQISDAVALRVEAEFSKDASVDAGAAK